MQQMSPLLARYNGFMLGHFLAMAAFRPLRTRYPLLRRRVNSFLDEIAISHRIPANADDYQVDPLAEILSILTDLRSQSTECASTAWLSSAVIFKARERRPSAERISWLQRMHLASNRDLYSIMRSLCRATHR